MNVTLDGKRMKLDSIVHYRESYSIALGMEPRWFTEMDIENYC